MIPSLQEVWECCLEFWPVQSLQFLETLPTFQIHKHTSFLLLCVFQEIIFETVINLHKVVENNTDSL